jgi:transcriptional regulator with XRE-family HTH domain
MTTPHHTTARTRTQVALARRAFIERRIVLGLSQQGLGALVGVGRTFISQLEKGDTLLPLARVDQFAAALGLSRSALLPLAMAGRVQLPHAPGTYAHQRNEQHN